MNKQHYSPLRYPGGKVSLYDFLKQSIEKNKIFDGIYIEGFAGGCGAALKLLMMEDVCEIHLNDKDELIYNFWQSVLNETDSLCKLIHDNDITISEWNYRKSVLKNDSLKSDLSTVELGYTAFFLNRSNRSGILKAGVIGGNNQDGTWKLDARFHKKDLINRINKIALYKERIHLYNYDILKFLKEMNTKFSNRKDIITYLDPPYVSQGKELYRYFFNDQNHLELAHYLQKDSNFKWILSYDDHELIHKIYKEVNKNILEFNYYANRTKVGNELIITSKNLLLPRNYIQYSRKKSITNKTLFKEAI